MRPDVQWGRPVCSRNRNECSDAVGAGRKPRGGLFRAGRAAAIASVFVLLAAIAGCRPNLETTKDAAPWPLESVDRAPPAGVDPNNWPQWRGYGAAGIGYGRPPTRFGPKEHLRWRAALPGVGHSSPVVWGDLILLTTAEELTEGTQLAVLGVSRSDGSIRFKTTVGPARGRTHAKNGYASPTVATDGRRVFAFFGAAGLFCCNIAGERLWHVELPNTDHVWGYGGSPVLFGDTVIVVADGENESFIAAFDQATGEQRWKTDRPSRGSWSTPVIVSPPSGSPAELIVNGTTHDPSGVGWVIAYDPYTGGELWRVGGTETFVTPTLLQCGPWVYSLSGRNGPIMAIAPGGRGDITETNVVWRTSNGGPYIPSAVAYRGRLFVVDDGGRAACYNAGDGTCLWRTRLSGSFTASVTAADGRVFAVSENGTCYVFAADDQFRLLAENRLGDRCYATPALVKDEIFIRTHHALWCFAELSASSEGNGGVNRPGDTDKAVAVATPVADGGGRAVAANPSTDRPRPSLPGPVTRNEEAPNEDESVAATGHSNRVGPAAWPIARGNPQASAAFAGPSPKAMELRWTFRGQGGFEGGAAIVDQVVYVGDNDGKFYALRLDDGSKRWEFDAKEGITAAPAVAQGFVYFGDVDGVFHALDAKTGEERWRFAVEGTIDNGANLHGDSVLFGSQDGYLYCLRGSDGKLIWKYDAGDQIRCVPTIVEPWAMVAGCDGRLHLVRLSDGQLDGQVDLSNPTGCTPAVCGSMAFVGTEGNEFLAIDFRQRSVAWTYQHRPNANGYRSSAACDGKTVVVGSRDKHLHAFEASSGRPRWYFAAKGRVDGSVAIVGGRAIAGAADGRVYMVDLTDGKEVDVFEAGGDITGSPAVAEGRLVIGNSRGQLYCLDLPAAAP